MDLDVKRIRQDFPNLHVSVHGKPLVYFDNAATTFKPCSIAAAMAVYYQKYTSNVHRGIHELSEKATAAYEGARGKVQKFLNARDAKEIIFTRGTTESINLVAATWGQSAIGAGDAILLTEMEHHSNLVPWQQLAQRVGAELRFVPVTDDGRLDLSSLSTLLDERVKLFAFTASSNVLGTLNPVKELVKKAHAAGALVLVDAAQFAAHGPIDVESWDCDFLAMSAHKMYGPTGVGILYGKQKVLEAMPPFLFEGDMILEVKKHNSTWNELPYKFEAGTPNIAGVIGFGASLAFLESLGWDAIFQHEQALTDYALTVLGGPRACGFLDRPRHIIAQPFSRSPSIGSIRTISRPFLMNRGSRFVPVITARNS